MGNMEIKRQPYFDIEDTIAEVDITRRQLGHWESQGLIEPELGAGANKYTVRDIGRLTALRHLIVEQKMPLALVKELVGRGINHSVVFGQSLLQTAALFENPPLDLDRYVIDFRNGSLSTTEDVAESWWNEHFATATENQVEQRAYDLILLLFRIVRGRLSKRAAFAERREEIMKELIRLADVARVQITSLGEDPGDTWASYAPQLNEDEGLVEGTSLTHVFLPRAKRLGKYRDALQGVISENDPRFLMYQARFWDDEELERARSKPSDFEDVPF